MLVEVAVECTKILLQAVLGVQVEEVLALRDRLAMVGLPLRVRLER
jgi:helix-turn-helix protein